MIKNKKLRDRTLIALAVLLLLSFGPFSYSQGVVTTELTLLDKYFSARVDLVPVLDKVLGENTVLKATVRELLRSVEFRDAVISDQADEILDLKNRPPEIVEVVVEVPVEVIVEVPGPERIVEVPGPIEYIYLPSPEEPPEPIKPHPPTPDPWDEGERDDSDRDDDPAPGPDSDSDPEPDPEPEPDDDCDRDKHKNDRGKGHHKGNGRGHR